MSLVAHLALVSEASTVGTSELTVVSAALQKQLSRDLGRVWDVQATISAFVRLEDVPPGYWPIIIRDDIERDATGFHCDDNGQPLALVTSGPGWSVVASHEAMEMVVDPFGNRTVAGQSPKSDQGRVEFLVEVCDPIGDKTYSINNIAVSDFCTPRYFDPFRSSGVQYSHMGDIPGPREIVTNGYLTWHDPASNEWWQQSKFASGEARIDSLGPILKTACGLRSSVDRLASRRRLTNLRSSPPVTSGGPSFAGMDVELRTAGMATASRAKAEAWRFLINKVIHAK